MQSLVPKYLEDALTSFASQQDQMRKAVEQTMGTFFPFGMEEVGRQNMAMMERAMSLFTPFVPGQDIPKTPPDETERLRAEVERLSAELATMKRSK